MRTRRSVRNQHILARALGLEGPAPKPERKRKPYVPRYDQRSERVPANRFYQHWHIDDSGWWLCPVPSECTDPLNQWWVMNLLGETAHA